ncbi:hypothetical protein [Streptomyces sp. NPDC000983]|uniref:hypothetical protein n=1 Tax=Streptomyces sp. NPDC000983 TaxID=3154373 RepID=UPI003329B373
MHSARMLLATAAASTVLVLSAPGAWAAGDEWDGDKSSSHSKEEKDTKEWSKDHKEWDKDHKEWDKDHDSPWGGMHTGGGALTAVGADPKFDPETYKDKGEKEWSKEDSGSWSGKEDGGWKHEKPSGGMHTGGGGLATPSVTAGGLAVLGVAGAGLYAARRKRAVGSVA